MPLSRSDYSLPDPQELARTIAENSVHGLVMMDEKGYCIYANQAWLDMTGFTLEEMRNNAVHDLVHHHYPDGRPFPIEECPIGCTLGKNEKVRNHYDLFFRKDGSSFPVCCSASPIAKDGTPILMILETRDVTEEKLAQQKLQESEARFRTMADVMPQMAWTTAADGAAIYYNRQWYEFTGVPLGSTDGHAWNRLLHPDDRESSWEAWCHSLRTGLPYETQQRIRHRSGEYRWTLARASPVRDASGAIVEWMGTNTDIHKQKMAEEALHRSNRQKDDFLAMLAHELRNPISPIVSAADLLLLMHSGDPQVRQAGEIIKRQGNHVAGLIDDLLDVSRVTRGLVSLEKGTVPIGQVVADAQEQVEPLIEARRHRLSVQLPAEPVFVLGDHKRLVQVLSNVLNNAAKYTPNGGDIRVVVTARPGEVTMIVRDNGRGMGPELLENAFELFQQGERTLARSEGGLGIGLAIVKSLVEQHDGTVEARSPGAGCGSEFIIRLPRVEAAADTHPATAEPGETGGLKRLKILVVDDNVDFAETAGTLLEILGSDVTVEHHPSAALAKTEKTRFDIYMLDIGLPGMDGYELARRIRAGLGGHRATFVALTGYGQQQDLEASRQAGFDRHFVKPIGMEALTELLAETAPVSEQA